MIAQTTLRDIPVTRLTIADAQADICPRMGANCINLRLRGADILRTPDSFSEYRENPNVYGEPLLFPPNRIAGGRYFFNGHEYTFPINEPSRGHHIHGFLSGTPFETAEASAGPDKTTIRFIYRATAQSSYLTFPHAFSVTRTFTLCETSLFDCVRLTNESNAPMPAGLGFHTSLRVRFMGGASDEARLFTPAGRQIMLNPGSFIPTGERIDTPLGAALSGVGVPAQGKAISAHFERHGAQPVRLQSGTSAVRYDVSPAFRYFMLWNCGGDKGFICPEPQTWMIDAPNQSTDERVSGFRVLAPHETLEIWTRFSVELS